MSICIGYEKKTAIIFVFKITIVKYIRYIKTLEIIEDNQVNTNMLRLLKFTVNYFE